MTALRAVLFGAGARGNAYAQFALDHPDQLRITAVAEPDTKRRERFADLHDLDDAHTFTSWENLLNRGKQGDVVFNCTQDQMHIESTLAALHAGYDILLEKPMAHTLAGSVQLVQAAEREGRLLQICHVLRYTPFFQALRQVLQSGKLGRIINVDHRENLVFWHMAHSFVRGNWRNLESSAPMILAKCCHDLDMLTWLLGQEVCYLSSFGSLTLFRPENAPQPDVPLRCTDGCPAAESCKYEAQRLYVRDVDGWPWNALTYEATEAARLEALKKGPYGRCVYRCDNDVVDHQTVTLELADDCTVTLIMNGQGFREGRTIRYDGTDATLTGEFTAGGNRLTIRHHHSGMVERVPIPERSGGHGGGDIGIVQAFLMAQRGEAGEGLTTARESLESHLLAFAAEESRLSHQTIDMAQFRERAWYNGADA